MLQARANRCQAFDDDEWLRNEKDVCLWSQTLDERGMHCRKRLIQGIVEWFLRLQCLKLDRKLLDWFLLSWFLLSLKFHLILIVLAFGTSLQRNLLLDNLS